MLLPNCSLVLLSNCSLVLLPNCSLVLLPNCSLVLLPNCSLVLLPNCIRCECMRRSDAADSVNGSRFPPRYQLPPGPPLLAAAGGVHSSTDPATHPSVAHSAHFDSYHLAQRGGAGDNVH